MAVDFGGKIMKNFTRKSIYALLSFFCISLLLIAGCSKYETKEEEAFARKESNYEADTEIEEGIKRLEIHDKKASLITDINTVEKIVTITFEGLADRETTDRLLDLLDEYKVQSVFFIPGIKSAEDPDTVKSIVARGQELGNFTLKANKEMEKYTNIELVKDFSRTNVIIREISGKTPRFLKCNVTQYNDELLKAANASNLEAIIHNKYFLNYQSFSSKEVAKNFTKSIKKGSILSIKLDSVLDELEYSSTKVKEEKQDKDKGMKDVEPKVETKDTKVIDEKEKLIKTVEMLLGALKEENYKILSIDQFLSYEDPDFHIDFDEIRKANGGLLAPLVRNINTTQKALALTFRYINDKNKLDKVLNLLEKKGVKGTFFVTGNEIIEYEEEMREIVKRGHHLANGGMNNDLLTEKTFNEISFEIYKCHQLLKEKFNVESHLFMPVYGKVNNTIMEAASALDYVVVTYNKNPITDEAKSVEEILGYFKNKFRRGDIVHFRLNLYKDVDKVLEKMIDKVKTVGYGFESVENLYDNKFETRPLKSIPGWDAIKTNEAYDPNADPSPRVIDTIPVTTKTVFITFDDWGSDKTITDILTTLNKYKVKAGFFLRVDGVDMNPNLARAISEAGHDVGNHTYAHEEISDSSIQDMLEDIVKGHQSLTKAINRQPELFFRPPRLMVANEPLNAILASGFKYIVMGDINTHDYKLPANEVVEKVVNNVQPGSIIIMHLNDTASASEALPIIIKRLREQGYHFAKISEYLN